MNKVIGVMVLCYTCLVMFVLIDVCDGGGTAAKHHRHRRYLSFLNVSRFFLRLNFKANMVPWNQIFAQALGFRMNWDDPPDSYHPHHHLYRRSVYSNLETLMDKNGLNGFQCIRRAICEMEAIAAPAGIYHTILKIIFRKQSSATEKWHNVTEEDCSLSLGACPFSMLDVSLYTDL